jgi:hypothetical protein
MIGSLPRPEANRWRGSSESLFDRGVAGFQPSQTPRPGRLTPSHPTYPTTRDREEEP